MFKMRISHNYSTTGNYVQLKINEENTKKQQYLISKGTWVCVFSACVMTEQW